MYIYLMILNVIYIVAGLAAWVTGEEIGTCLSMTHAATLVVLALIVMRNMRREGRPS